LTKIIEIFPADKYLLNVSSIILGVVLLSTIKKFVSPLTFLSPIPANKNPVTVSSSPITAIKDDYAILLLALGGIVIIINY
jgi:hypothetical protein